MLAVAAADEDNLTFPGSGRGWLSRVRRPDNGHDRSDSRPADQVCNSRSEAVAGSVSAPVGMKRAVAHLTVTVVGVGSALLRKVSTVSIPRMYDRIASDGTPGNSGAEFPEKAIVLARNSAGRHARQAVVLPTDTASATLEFRFTINGKNLSCSVQETRIEAENCGNTRFRSRRRSKRRYRPETYARDQLSPPGTLRRRFPTTGCPPWTTVRRYDDFTVAIFRNGCWEEIFVDNTRSFGRRRQSGCGVRPAWALQCSPMRSPLR